MEIKAIRVFRMLDDKMRQVLVAELEDKSAGTIQYVGDVPYVLGRKVDLQSLSDAYDTYDTYESAAVYSK